MLCKIIDSMTHVYISEKHLLTKEQTYIGTNIYGAIHYVAHKVIFEDL